MVEGSGLENRQAERLRGFESLPLRQLSIGDFVEDDADQDLGQRHNNQTDNGI